MSPPADTLEERVERIERLLQHVLLKAEQNPVGRRILVALGLWKKAE